MAQAVRATTTIPRIAGFSLMRRVISSPSIPGIWISASTRLGRSSGMALSACSASDTAWTRNPSLRRTISVSFRFTEASSTTRMVSPAIEFYRLSLCTSVDHFFRLAGACRCHLPARFAVAFPGAAGQLQQVGLGALFRLDFDLLAQRRKGHGPYLRGRAFERVRLFPYRHPVTIGQRQVQFPQAFRRILLKQSEDLGHHIFVAGIHKIEQ